MFKWYRESKAVMKMALMAEIGRLRDELQAVRCELWETRGEYLRLASEQAKCASMLEEYGGYGEHDPLFENDDELSDGLRRVLDASKESGVKVISERESAFNALVNAVEQLSELQEQVLASRVSVVELLESNHQIIDLLTKRLEVRGAVAESPMAAFSKVGASAVKCVKCNRLHPVTWKFCHNRPGAEMTCPKDCVD